MRASTDPNRPWADSTRASHDSGVGDVGDVGGHPLPARVELGGDGVQRLGGAGGQHHVGPVPQGAGRALAAQAVAHAGDEDGLPFEDHPPLLDRIRRTGVHPVARLTGCRPARAATGWPDRRSGFRATASTPAPAGYIRARWFHEHSVQTSIT